MRSSVEGPGRNKVVLMADPGAGNQLIVFVPVGAVWALKSVLFGLVTSAAAGNRRVTLILDDGTNQFHRVVFSSDVIASKAYTFTASIAYQDIDDRNTVIVGALPAVKLPAGYSVRTVTTEFDGGDVLSVGRLMVEEWIEI